MEDMKQIKERIQEVIRPNGVGAITAADHQALLLDMVETIDSNKANKSGRHPAMSVGFADNLTGHGESVPAEFTFRASGGKSIADGAARIKVLRGNSVVVNGQLLHSHVEAIKSVGDNAFDASEAMAGDVNDTTGVFTQSTSTYYSYLIKCIPGEQYYFLNALNGYYKASVYYYGETMDYIKYNYVSQGSGYNSSGVLTTPSNAHYMRVQCHEDYLNSCMVTLVHSGWKQDTDAGYQPYWADVLTIDPRIREAFPNGMMSYDYAFNKNGKGFIVKGSAVANGRVIEVDSPEVLEFEQPFMFDYRVADFGTEEAISSKPSAPFRADIIYQFNAVDMIRQNYAEIQNLKEIIAKLAK